MKKYGMMHSHDWASVCWERSISVDNTISWLPRDSTFMRHVKLLKSRGGQVEGSRTFLSDLRDPAAPLSVRAFRTKKKYPNTPIRFLYHIV